jgi:hypothetical protein
MSALMTVAGLVVIGGQISLGLSRSVTSPQDEGPVTVKVEMPLPRTFMTVSCPNHPSTGTRSKAC